MAAPPDSATASRAPVIEDSSRALQKRQNRQKQLRRLIQALNSAIREWSSHMRDVADQNPHAQVFVRVLAFSSLARWWTPRPVPIEQFRLDPLVAGGASDVGRALELVADELHIPPMPSSALPPVLVLVTDGAATDDFKRGLDRLLAEPWGRQAVRLGIAIGEDADLEMLQQFIDNPELAPLEARNADQLARYIRWAEVEIDEAVVVW